MLSLKFPMFCASNQKWICTELPSRNGKVAQYAERLHRNYPGKNEVQIYDYVDIHVPVLENMYQKRLKGYATIGYKIKIEGVSQVNPDLIYDGKSFYPVFSKIVWYGSVNFLSFGTAEESIMRFTSHDIAEQLMDTVL